LKGSPIAAERNVGKLGAISVDGTVSEFAVPDVYSGPWGIGAGSDGNLWFTESIGSRVGIVVP
jgi:virginiamycin B lyase